MCSCSASICPTTLPTWCISACSRSFDGQAQQLRAQGSAEADKIRADAEHARAEMLADATREAQRIRGEADAAAAATYAEAYGANPGIRGLYPQPCRPTRTSLGREGDILVHFTRRRVFQISAQRQRALALFKVNRGARLD